MPVVDYRDTVTGEIFELFMHGQIQECVKSEKGNDSVRVYTGTKGMRGTDAVSENRAFAKKTYEGYKRAGRY